MQIRRALSAMEKRVSRGDAEVAEEEFEENKDAFSLCFFLSASPREIFFITLRMRSLPMSAMVLYPALKASLSSAQGSGIWTRINLRLPPSCLFWSSTAWAVVPEPVKKSRMMLESARPQLINLLKSVVGLGNSKMSLLKSPLISLAESWEKPPYHQCG